jgi:CheY-like chemotaxis protein
VADNAELFLALQNSFLKRSGCELLTARSVDEAVEKAGSEFPDIIILDADMSGFDGLECCRKLKEDPAMRHTPVVIVGKAVDLELCERAGAEALLSWPLANELFLEAVRNLVPLPQRKSRRVAVELDIDYRWHEQDGSAKSKDLSVDGLFLKSRKPFVEGELLSLAFDLPVLGGSSLALGGKIVRRVPPEPDSHLIPGAGILFQDAEAADRLKIARFVERIPGEAP